MHNDLEKLFRVHISTNLIMHIYYIYVYVCMYVSMYLCMYACKKENGGNLIFE